MGTTATSKLVILLSIFLFISKSYALSDKSDYQYISDIDQTKGDLNIDVGINFGMGEIDDTELDNLRQNLNIGYVFHENQRLELGIRHSMFTYAPWDYVDIDIADQTSAINLSYNYIKNVNDILLILGSHISMPIFKSSAYLIEKHIYTQGTRRYTTGASFALTNQVIKHNFFNITWNIGVEYDIGLPQKEDDYASWEPGAIKIMGHLALDLSKTIKLLYGVQQTILFPQDIDIVYATVINSGFSTFRNDNFFIISGRIFALPIQEHLTGELILAYGHKFNTRK
jgi:hypothetical protein